MTSTMCRSCWCRARNCFESLDPIRQAGPSAILRKPFGQEDLVRGLEAATAFVNAADDAHKDAAEFESLRVLAVDDTRVARKFIVRTLRRMGIEDIVEAENGVDAVGKLEEAVYDLVITDFNMPEMDGLGLVRHIRDESHQSSVPIIMVTSEDNEETPHSGSRGGRQRHLRQAVRGESHSAVDRRTRLCLMSQRIQSARCRHANTM